MRASLGPTTAVRRGHELDRGVIERYLAERIDGFRGPVEIRQFEGGQSNPTYLLAAASGHYVLRKQPPGPLLPSAHAVDREYRVLTALSDSDVPVPKALAMCNDSALIGTPFFVMECVAGRVFRQPHLPGVSAPDRARMYDHMADVLARLHRIDAVTAGLGDYGKPGSYFARQIARWSRQYVAAKTDEIEAMHRLMEWLPSHIPAGDDTSIVHGDYRVENLIFHPDEPRIVAVVDWELSTLGHPLADLAYSCLTYHLPPDALGIVEANEIDRAHVPDEADFVAMYCGYARRSGVTDWNFYLAFAMFRLASILQGVYARGIQGNAASAYALQRGAAARAIADIAWRLVSRQ